MRLLILTLLCACGLAVAGETFRLQDYLGRSWKNECVTFALNDAQLQQAKAGRALTGPGGAAVPYQIVSTNGVSSVAFQTDLNPFEIREFQFTDAAADQKTDLKVEESPDKIVLSNGRTGVAIRTKLDGGKGPLEGVRLNSGLWAGTSLLESDTPPAEYKVEITARGPVYAEAVCRVKFGESTWDIAFRVYANEPVVLLDETFNVSAAKIKHVIDLSHNFGPDTLLHRRGRGPYPSQTGAIAPGEVYVLDPWLHWWERDRQGQCFALYKNAGSTLNDAAQQTPVDMLSVAARESGAWVDPSIPKNQRAPSQIFVTKNGETLSMAMQLKRGVRKWMFSALNARECLAPFKGQPSIPGISLADAMMIKHGQFPLDSVIKYTLKWPSEQTTYPRLFVTKEGLPELRKNIPKPEIYTARVADFRQGKFSQYSLDGIVTPTSVYFVTGDEGVARNIAENAVPMMQTAVDAYLNQPELPLGVAPHVQQSVATYLAMADGGLAYEKIAPEIRERLLAQIAFLGYVFDSPNYWSPVRGYRANPNMTTAVNGYKMMVACLLPSHPKAKDWASDALTELKHQLTNWSDENGGWLEAPHYAAAGFDQLVASLMMAKNAGLDDSLYHPRLKKIAEWFAKISTPPDSRLAGTRHLPPIGNTYLTEPSGIFGTMANLWKDRDPEFAASMQWMFEQHRSWPHACIGGGYPGMIGCNGIYRGSTIAPKAPAYGSELFPKTGVMLRDVFPAERETQLHLIAGTNHEHYDDDSGSITLWGLGRVIADDFGYYGMAPQNDHSLVMAPGVGGVMKVDAFSTSANLDYVHGVKGPWTRQIAFVKSKDANCSPYFVIADTMSKPTNFTWLLWLVARNVALGKREDDLAKEAAEFKGSVLEDGTAMDPRFSQASESARALMVGREDVDMDIVALTPSAFTLRTEKKTRRANAGLDSNFKQSQMDSTQIGLVAESKQGGGFTVLLYPRLKTQAAPVVSVLCDGAGAKIQTAAGTDYVFLSNSPVTFKEGDVSFSGTSGLIQIRGDKATLSLGAAGTISARGNELKK
ncbi:MAG TPA: hypothetical protein VEK08_16125 [Planctomycetota bacterium]|nr:hypothetical protein [Planctomycetota bacterium]